MWKVNSPHFLLLTFVAFCGGFVRGGDNEDERSRNAFNLRRLEMHAPKLFKQFDHEEALCGKQQRLKTTVTFS